MNEENVERWKELIEAWLDATAPGERMCETCLGYGKTGWAPTGPEVGGLGREMNEVSMHTIMHWYPDDGTRDVLWQQAGPCSNCNGRGLEGAT